MAQPFILIVDDEPNQRFIIEQALQALARTWRIQVCSSAVEALKTIDLQAPDLIITDYHMPVLDGLGFIHQIRQKQLVMPVMLITAYNSAEVLAEANRLGVLHCLTKPVPLATLRQLTVEALCSTAANETG